jgi:uncharacterized membrane protein
VLLAVLAGIKGLSAPAMIAWPGIGTDLNSYSKSFNSRGFSTAVF